MHPNDSLFSKKMITRAKHPPTVSYYVTYKNERGQLCKAANLYPGPDICALASQDGAGMERADRKL